MTKKLLYEVASTFRLWRFMNLVNSPQNCTYLHTHAKATAWEHELDVIYTKGHTNKYMYMRTVQCFHITVLSRTHYNTSISYYMSMAEHHPYSHSN